MSLIRGGKVLKARPGQAYQAPVVMQDAAGHQQYVVFINTDVSDTNAVDAQFSALPTGTIGIEMQSGTTQIFQKDAGGLWQLLAQ